MPSDSPWGTIKALTSATDGTKFVPFQSQPATSILIVNAPEAIDIQRYGSADWVTIAAGVSIGLDCIGDTSEVAVRRNNQTTGSVTVRAVWQNGNPAAQV
jgi:hypothetical protein